MAAVEAPVCALVRLAEANAFMPAFGLGRRETLWAIKALRDERLPLFAAAAARIGRAGPEVDEPAVTIKPMAAGRDVVEDYRHVGLILREHTVSFLRAELAPKASRPARTPPPLGTGAG